MKHMEKMLRPTLEIKKQIKELVLICDQFDGTTNVPYVDNAFNQYANMNSIFLCYEDDKLVGFISVYADDDPVAELIAFVLPDERRKGVFTHLLKEVKEELTKFEYLEVAFKANVKYKDHLKLVKKFRCAVDNKEYFMTTAFSNLAVQENISIKDITVDYAIKEDLQAVAAITAEAFDSSEDSTYRNLTATFDMPINKLLVIKEKGKIVGTASVEIGEGYSHLFGLCVASDYRGKGIGRQGLFKIVQMVQEEVPQPFSLEVEKANEQALKLYEYAGFRVVSEFHYCEMSLNKIK